MRALIFAMVLAAGQCGLADDKKGQPMPLPDNVIKAWKEAGATVGWMKVEDSGVLSFIEKPEAGAIPAFRFAKWKDGVVPKLPVPESLFGLDISGTDLMDAGLKELANFKNLGRLCICNTKVSDEEVEKLQKALPKCLIVHC
jgi:hypothetical protein